MQTARDKAGTVHIVSYSSPGFIQTLCQAGPDPDMVILAVGTTATCEKCLQVIVPYGG